MVVRDFHRYHRERPGSAPLPSGWEARFPSKEPPFRPNLRYINPDVGYEVPFRSSKTSVSGGESSLDQRLVDTKPDGWRSSSRYIDPGSGSLSERPFRPCLKKVPGPADNRSDAWRSSKHAVEHVDECKHDLVSDWKSTRHRPSVYGEWYLGDTSQGEWRSSKKSGAYTHQAEWIPPFREYEGKVPKRFYSVVPGKAAKAKQTGKRKSTMYNQFATTFDKNLHYDEFKKPLGGIKTKYKNEHQWPFNPLPPPRCKKRFYTHINHHEGVGTLLNPKKDYDYNSYVFL